MKYRSVVLGGTFDTIHKGHEALLNRAFEVGERVTIGLTSDEFVKQSRIQNLEFRIVQNNRIRKQNLMGWLKTHGLLERARIVPIDDPFGPTILSSDELGCTDAICKRSSCKRCYDAIIVSSETRKTAEEINEIREKQGLSRLTIITVPIIAAEDLKTISSTRVRQNEIDLTGRLIMPDSLRPELGKPLGQIFRNGEVERIIQNDQGKIIITVGDATTKKLLADGIIPVLAIIDQKVNRKPFVWTKTDMRILLAQSKKIKIKSGPGYISRQAIKEIKNGFRQQKLNKAPRLVLVIDGEEDLLTLPAVAYSPIGSVVYYGQPGVGLVRVAVTAKKQKEAKNLLARFDIV